MEYNLASDAKPLPPNTPDAADSLHSSYASFNKDSIISIKNNNIDEELEFEEFINPKTTNPYVIVGIVWLIGFMLSFILEFVLKL